MGRMNSQSVTADGFFLPTYADIRVCTTPSTLLVTLKIRSKTTVETSQTLSEFLTAISHQKRNEHLLPM
jgi:hypothetical protein